MAMIQILLTSFFLVMSTIRDARGFPAQARLSKEPASSAPQPQQGKTCFKPWKQPIVVCNGDYSEQTFLEDYIGGPLYQKQKSLPHLPIPMVQETINRFLPTALPLAENEDEIKALEKACHCFQDEAKILQERLLSLYKQCPNSSWLQEMWQESGYLAVRDPIAVLVSYYLFVPDDESIEEASRKGIARAAAVMTALAESRKQICSGKMPCESIARRDGDDDFLCSAGFKYIFHSSRIPRSRKDVYRLYDPSCHDHCIVASRGQFFRVKFVDDHGDPLPLSVLEEVLTRCVDLSLQQTEYPQIGWLTSSQRNVWAQARESLLLVGGDKMEKALATIESAAFLLCLDEEEPDTLTEQAKEFWYGGDAGGGANRWFDKAIQLIVSMNGHVGYQGEHSMLDASPVIPIIRRILKTSYKRLSKKQQYFPSISSEPTTDHVANVFEECWESKPTLEAATKLTSKAKSHHQKLSGDYEVKVLKYEGFGKIGLKKAALGPEVAQLAMQLAGYRLFGKQVATYEAALTRTFVHGRTETVRPVSPESSAFLQCMGKKRHSGYLDMKLKLLKKAAEVHRDRQSLASRGLGVDRHLFGLEMMVKKEDETIPSLFSNPLYVRSKTWRLSTSTVIFTPGFGPVTKDGLGIGFQMASDSCTFTCSSLRSNDYVQRFCDLLEEALEEIDKLMQDTKN